MIEMNATFKDKAVRKFLSKIESNVNEFSEGQKKFWTWSSAIVFADIINHFEAEKGPKSKWPDIKNKVYREFKIKSGKEKLLQFKGILRQGFMPIKTSQNMGYKKNIGLFWVNKVKYAITHDLGSKKKKIPQRQFMWLSDKAFKKITQTSLDKILE